MRIRKTTMFHYLLTCMGRKLEPSFYEALTDFIQERGILRNGLKILAEKEMACVAISLASEKRLDRSLLMKALAPLNQPFGIDLFVQEDGASTREKRLVALDLESTLIQAEVLDELAKEIGIGEKIAGLTQRAMNGEIAFPEALRERVALLEGLPAQTLGALYQRIALTPGAVELMATLRKRRYTTAILTGGFDYFAKRYKNGLHADYAFSNRLEIKNGRLTGRVLGEIVDGPKKAALMEEIATIEGISLDHTVAIGDGANDLPMMFKAGMGIAFNAKPAVQKAAPYCMNQKTLTAVLYVLGISENEIISV